VAVLSRGSVPVDGMVWVEDPATAQAAAQQRTRKRQEGGRQSQHKTATWSAHC
jgi:hypothetical protein